MVQFSHKIAVRSSTQIVATEAIKLNLRVDDSDEDSDIERMIFDVAESIESYLGRFLLETTIEERLTDWCALHRFYYQDVIRIDKVEYYDETETLQELAAANYELWDLKGEHSIAFPDLTAFPQISERPDPVKITYICGYGNDVTDIPRDITNAAYLLVSSLYDLGADSERSERAAHNLLEKHRVYL